ncbi:hypothetical protein [Humisphaera borealis]|uniref:Calcium-binding protein n=1 Tax=Humisphaera borealis TaxID=2807512 RepID=A0A7M2WQK7_9BACT|nr:hypothetical protein [Humisphaera borealis]QOV87524.1 hypothetical protein IPV69_14630 [Humisphaera borealis]
MNFEALESRQLLSANPFHREFDREGGHEREHAWRKLSSGIYQNGSTLLVNGTADDDAVNIYEDVGGVNVNEKVYSRVKLIIVSLGGGNDFLSFDLSSASIAASTGAGDDFLVGSLANGRSASLDTGDGHNFVSVAGDASRRLSVTVEGGAEDDRIQLSGIDKAYIDSEGGDDDIFAADIKELVVNAGAGNDKVSVSNQVGKTLILGGSGDDTIDISGTGDFSVFGGVGADLINNSATGYVVAIA